MHLVPRETYTLALLLAIPTSMPTQGSKGLILHPLTNLMKQNTFGILKTASRASCHAALTRRQNLATRLRSRV